MVVPTMYHGACSNRLSVVLWCTSSHLSVTAIERPVANGSLLKILSVNAGLAL